MKFSLSCPPETSLISTRLGFHVCSKSLTMLDRAWLLSQAQGLTLLVARCSNSATLRISTLKQQKLAGTWYICTYLIRSSDITPARSCSKIKPFFSKNSRRQHHAQRPYRNGRRAYEYAPMFGASVLGNPICNLISCSMSLAERLRRCWRCSAVLMYSEPHVSRWG